ncbi:MAG: hypothetical protein Fur0010_19240 [Bdellovibrio sp.]
MINREHRPDLGQRGMSLIEVMVAAGLMGVMAYMGMMLYEQQNRQSRDLQSRFEVQDVLAQISSLLANPDSCQASLGVVDITQADTVPGPPFLTEFIGVDKNNKAITKDRFLTKLNDSTKKYGNNLLQIDRYEISTNGDEEMGLNQELKKARLYFNIYFDRGDKVAGASVLRKSVIVNFELGDNNKIVSCYSQGMGGGKGSAGNKLVIIDPSNDSTVGNLSGAEACAKKGLTCVAVHSHNFVNESYGDPSIGQVCASAYNQNLPGVKNSAPKSPWHQCNAKLGIFTTFTSASSNGQGGVQCQAIFSAFCQ